MITKNIFKALALAMMIPAMMLTTACSSDDSIVNNEPTAKKGYPLQVTVNVTRQGDAATRAAYNESTKKLSFSSGDQLFVGGNYNTTGSFAGALTWVSGETFSGTITTNEGWVDTADALFTAAYSVHATLLPNGYKDYHYFIDYPNNGYNADVIPYDKRAFALTKKLAVEQFSYEYTNSYSSGTGFALSPHNAILNFTITGLAANKKVDVALDGALTIDKEVTTDGSGNATFAVGIFGGTDLNDLSLTVGGNAITLCTASKTLEAGHIYNITRNLVLASVTTEDKGKVIGANGNIYANVAAAKAASTTAVAMIVYVGSETGDATYNHGLALALSDEGMMNWSSAKTACEGHTPVIPGGKWKLATQDEWNNMMLAAGEDEYLRDGFYSVGGTNMKSDIYWSSTESSQTGFVLCWDFKDNDGWSPADMKYDGFYARACLVF